MLTVVEFLAEPPPLSGLMDLKLEHMPVLDLVAIRADVVGGLPELAHDAELAQAGFLARLAQGGVLRGFSRPDASGKDLDADVLQVVVGVAEDQELVVSDDVAQHLLVWILSGIASYLGSTDGLIPAWKVGVRNGSACPFAGEPVYRAIRK